ncbi:MAG: PD40 domain-containing protein [Pseudomonadales bacterium]|nr:PD40 domain-containing protein [Pseudomonadales bacterium]
MRLLWVPLLGCLLACDPGQSGINTGTQSPDPVVVDQPIAYIERSLIINDITTLPTENLLAPAAFNPGARLLIKDRASPNAPVRQITSALFAEDVLYDVKDLDISPDGQKLVFALRAPDTEDTPADWDLWLYDISADRLTPVMGSGLLASAGNDISPAFLPDGRIVFSSDRQSRSRALLLDELKPQYSALTEDGTEPAFLLHIIDEDGRNLRQISFNQSHDLDPLVLADGRILFQRWDNAARRNRVSYYAIHPDGSQLSRIYGYNSQNSGTSQARSFWYHSRAAENGEIIASLRDNLPGLLGGDLVSLDILGFSDNDVPVEAGHGGAAQRSLTAGASRSDALPSTAGHYYGAWPLYDGTGRMLVSWSQCRLVSAADAGSALPCTQSNLADPALSAAPPLFSLWVFNPDDNTQLPLETPQEDRMVTEVAVFAERPVAFIPDAMPGNDNQLALADENLASVNIRSVYDVDGSDSSPEGLARIADPALTDVSARPARYLRLVRPVPLPDDDTLDFSNAAFGVSRNQLLREVIGYVPVEPDGSAHFAVPADQAFGIEITDASGRRISARHNNWLHASQVTEIQCNGCHVAGSTTPHGRTDAEPATINTGADAGISAFPGTNGLLAPEPGETMAETRSRLLSLPRPTIDPVYSEIWQGNDMTPQATAGVYTDLETPLPVAADCLNAWQRQCRIVINYPTHIAPLWELPRQTAAGQDVTCQSCHTLVDEMGAPRVPAAQLALLNIPAADNPEHLMSYRELLLNDTELELDATGNLLVRMVQATDQNGNPRFQTDENGDLILDSLNQPVPVLVPVVVVRSMSVNGALASSRFFAPFAANGSHAGWLSEAELRLLSEWLDIGAQYYNNPFDVPEA